jgi:hypothetical protein
MTTILDNPALHALQAQGFAFRATDLVHQSSDSLRLAAEVEVDVKLPKRSPLAASFSREKAHHRLVKLLRDEIQTGDDAFDATVYISTDTPAAARELLDKPRARQIIQRLIGSGGFLSVEDQTLVYVQVAPNRAEAHQHGDDLAWLLTEILNLP